LSGKFSANKLICGKPIVEAGLIGGRVAATTQPSETKCAAELRMNTDFGDEIRSTRMSAPKSNSPTVVTYVESNTGVGLEPIPNAKVLFKALLFHRLGFEEKLQFFVGPSRCGIYDVLWCNSDAVDGRELSAIAWLPKGILVGPALWEALLVGCWGAEKTGYNSDGPNFNEIITDKQAALSSEEVWAIVDRIWSFHETS
jgi:hypothetical protein